MNNTEARQILGLEPKDDLRAYLPDFEATKKYKKELILNAPNDLLRFRYEQNLLEYEAAISVVVGQKKFRPNTDFIAVLMCIIALCVCGWWGYNWYQKIWNQESENQQRIAHLNTVGRNAIAKRKWLEAEKAYAEIIEIDPNSRIATEGNVSIKLGQTEERSQQVHYSLGESQAALEASRWDEAESLVNAVLKIEADNVVAEKQLALIYKGRYKQTVSLKILTITEAVRAENISKARKAMADLRDIDPENANLAGLTEHINKTATSIRQRKEQSITLLERARKLDNGEFSAQAISLLAEARNLNPRNTEISELLSKMSSYTRAINVPLDFPTITEAVAAARPKDLILIAPGIYRESLEITKPIRIQGSTDGGTVIKIAATEASIITIHPQAKGTLISGLMLQHEGFDHSDERFSAVTVKAQEVSIIACSILQAGGHGIAVLENASAAITGCLIKGSGWDGISVYGNASLVTIRDTKSQANIQHGLGIWGGGSGNIRKSNLSKNGFCGIFAMGLGTKVNITETICSYNREAGILISNRVSAIVNANRCDKNLLSGIVVRDKDTRVRLTNNVTENNEEAGLITYQGVLITEFKNNNAKENAREQILRDISVKKTSE